MATNRNMPRSGRGSQFARAYRHLHQPTGNKGAGGPPPEPSPYYGEFDGVTHRISEPTHTIRAALDIANSYTITVEFWFEDADITSNMLVFSSVLNATNKVNFGFHGTGNSTNRRMALSAYDGAGIGGSFPDNTAQPGQWNQLIAVWDGGAKSWAGSTLNGVGLSGTLSQSTGNNLNFHIGSGSNDAIHFQWKGRIRDFVIQGAHELKIDEGSGTDIVNHIAPGAPGVLSGDPVTFWQGAPAPIPIAVIGVSDLSLEEGVQYQDQISASGGTGPYTYSATGLPAGITVEANTGDVAGIPSVNGSFPVTFTAEDTLTATGDVQQTMEVAASLYDQRQVYVDSTNTAGPWDGTAGNPWQTIGDAMTGLQEGDTVNIAAGIYSERIDPFPAVNYVKLVGAKRESDGQPLATIVNLSESPTWTNTGGDVWKSSDFAGNIENLYLFDSDGRRTHHGALIPFVGIHQWTHPDTNQVMNADDGTGVYSSLWGRAINYDGGAGVVYWDAFNACSYQDSINDVHIRFADGRDPNNEDIRAIRNNDRGIQLYNGAPTGIVFDSLRFVGFDYGIYGRGSTINSALNWTARDCWFTANRRGAHVFQHTGAYVERCHFDLGQGFLSYGAWGTADGGLETRDGGNREIGYEFDKYATNEDNTRNNGFSIQYGREITVADCFFTGGMQALSTYGQAAGLECQKVTFEDNYISSLSSVGIFVTTGNTELEITRNEISNVQSAVRLGSINLDYEYDIDFYNNLIVNPHGIGNDWFNHTDGLTNPTKPREIRYYHNTVAAGGDAMSYFNINLPSGLPWVHMLNNFFSTQRRVFENTPEAASGETIGTFDYNWHSSGTDDGLTGQSYYGANNVYDPAPGSGTYWGASDPKSLVIAGGHASQTMAGPMPAGWHEVSGAGGPVGCDLPSWADGRNILPASHDFTNAAWVIDGCQLTADASIADPYGGTGAYLLETLEPSTFGYHNIVDLSVLPQDGLEYIYSLYVRFKRCLWDGDPARPVYALANRNVAGSNVNHTLYDYEFNHHRQKATGDPATNYRFESAGSEYANFGWRRIWAIRKANGGGNFDAFGFYHAPPNDDLNLGQGITWTHVDASRLSDCWIFGAQLELSNGRKYPTPLEFTG